MIVEILLVIVGLLWFVYKYSTSQYTYWKDRSIPYVEPHFPFGTEKNFIFPKIPISEHFQNYYNKFKNAKMVGIYNGNQPTLLIKDPELIKNMFVGDFSHFVDRGLGDADLVTPINKNLFFLEGETWRRTRSKIIPAFTSGKMKMMYYLMDVCSDEFTKALSAVAEKHGKLNVKDFIGMFTADVIASCAFGIELNSINEPDSEFRQNLKKVFQKPPLSETVKFLFSSLLPQVYKFLRLPLLTNNVSDDFFMKLVSDAVEFREKKSVVRNDLIDSLLKIKYNKTLSDEDTIDAENRSNGSAGDGLTMVELAAHSVGFLLGGFESTASTMTFCLYELAVNQDIQQRLQKEVDEVFQKYSGKITYQVLQEMPYLEAVINETQRRYVSIPILNRKCTNDYEIPDSNLVVPKGMSFIIPVHAIHHDPQYYPDPYKFNPERFLNDAIKTKNNFTFMPFGEGPRMCIGNRFATLQMKTCLTKLINSFQFSVTNDTPIPIKISKQSFLTASEKDIILKISNRANK